MSIIGPPAYYPPELEELDWFHSTSSRHVAESLLLQNGLDGAYLLRPSSRPGELALSVRCKGSVKHFNITWTGQEYKFGMGVFATMSDFVTHFENQPLLAGESGVLTLLKYPYPRNVEEPKTYETVRIHAEMGRSPSIKEKTDFSVNSKEGFLTKQGGNFKTWRTRWFVLVKNELKYYKDRFDKEPIRTIDLTECETVEFDHKSSKENCIKLVLPWRTFYMYATTEDDAKEWLQLIRWKLEHIQKDKDK